MFIKRWQRVGSRLIVTLRGKKASARCTTCPAVSGQVHGHYWRQVEDLPCSGWHVTLEIAVRRFRCNNAICPRRTFAESLPALALRYQRRSNRLRSVLWHIGLALSGIAGARLARALGIAVSGETILRLLKRTTRDRLPSAQEPPPRVVGIDDWAFRRGHRYGTILVDMQTRRVLELLPDRDPKTVALWLTAHRSVHIVTRERAGVYSEGIKQGAPQAIQVADRWHLLKNLGDALERLMNGCLHDLRQTAHSLEQADVAVAPMMPPPLAFSPRSRNGAPDG